MNDGVAPEERMLSSAIASSSPVVIPARTASRSSSSVSPDDQAGPAHRGDLLGRLDLDPAVAEGTSAVSSAATYVEGGEDPRW